MANDNADPTGWPDDRLEEHAREFCDLPIVQPGPLETPTGHPDLDDDQQLGARTW